MPAQDTSQIKEKILNIIKKRGPSLPVHIAREIELSILFTSAFLSELLSEKKLKISNMRVGSSPIYFIPGQELLLERFSQYLKSKEKDSFLLLKEKKFLKDSEQNPAIRVALREIKDFAIPFKKPDTEEVFWRYFSIQETEFKIKEKPRKIEIVKEERLDVFDKEKPIKKKTLKKKVSIKNEKFFSKVKEFLSERSIELKDIDEFNKNELVLRINIDGKERLLIAYNKKRINDNDIIKANKKAKESGLSYIILSLGEPLKKMNALIESIKNLVSIEKLK